MKRLLILLVLAAMMGACTSKLQRENQALQEEIDELRESLPERIEQNLAEGRARLAHTDSLLTLVTARHDSLHQWVMDHSRQMNDQSPEVLQLNSLRAQKDSLEREFALQAEYVKRCLARQKKS